MQMNVWAYCHAMEAKCKYKEIDRCLKEQCSNALNDNNMIIEIIEELTGMNDTSSVISEKVLLSMRRIQAQ